MSRRALLLAASLAALAPLAGACAGAPRARHPLRGPRLPLTATPDAPFRARRPPLAPPAAFAPPVAAPLVLANGLRVLVVSLPGAPTTSATYVTRAGGDDPRTPAGLAALTLAALTPSLAPYGTDAVGDALGAHGVQLTSRYDDDFAALEAQSLPEELPAALDALARLACRAPLDARDVANVRAERLDRAAATFSGGRGTAVDFALANLFGTAHPYGRPTLGTPSTLHALELSDVAEFYGTRYVPAVSALVVAGDTTRDAVAALLERSFGACARAPAPTPAPTPPTAEHHAPRIYLLHQREMPTAELHFALQAPRAGAREELPFAMVASVLQARLRERLRRRDGVTYGVHVTYDAGREAGTLLVETAVARDSAADAVRELRAATERLGEAPVSARELAAAKAGARAALVEDYATDEAAAERVATLFARGLPVDADATLAARIDAVTAEQLRAAAALVFAPGEGELVLVGDAREIEWGLRMLGGAEVVIYTFENR